MSEEQKRGFNFEKLDVWQRAQDLAAFIYDITAKFPPDERFGLSSQMRRAAISVSSNIAEGSSRSSRQDFARFVELAVGSLYELVSQGFIARKQEFIAEQDFQKLYAESDELIRMFSGLRKHLRS
ncbi:MAG: four helix bundle protein [Chthoniobacterales bacterium]|nr:four helix bundle protein [Chthoniobacterales bacterium]